MERWRESGRDGEREKGREVEREEIGREREIERERETKRERACSAYYVGRCLYQISKYTHVAYIICFKNITDIIIN